MTWHDYAIAALLVDLCWRVGKGMSAAYRRVTAEIETDAKGMAMAEWRRRVDQSNGQQTESAEIYYFDNSDTGRKH